jgi:hypothetical protein
MRMDLDTKGKVKVADQFWHRDMELGAPVEICGCELGTVPRQGDPRARSEEISWRLELSLLRIYLKQRTERSRVRRTSLPITDLPKPERAARFPRTVAESQRINRP